MRRLRRFNIFSNKEYKSGTLNVTCNDTLPDDWKMGYRHNMYLEQGILDPKAPTRKKRLDNGLVVDTRFLSYAMKASLSHPTS